MEFQSVDDILEFAKEREEEAVEFYANLAKEATIESLKEVFQNFSKEEVKHVELMADMAGNKAKIDAYEFKEITDLKISDYMVEAEYEQGMPMPEILKVAMKKEEKAVKLYADLATKTDNKDAQKVFNVLVQEEQKHKLYLESLYDDYLADQEG